MFRVQQAYGLLFMFFMMASTIILIVFCVKTSHIKLNEYWMSKYKIQETLITVISNFLNLSMATWGKNSAFAAILTFFFFAKLFVHVLCMFELSLVHCCLHRLDYHNNMIFAYVINQCRSKSTSQTKLLNFGMAVIISRNTQWIESLTKAKFT